MTSFKITAEMLQAKGACDSSLCDYLKAYPREKYPDGVEYQELLDRCAEEGRRDCAEWVLSAFGAIKSELRVESIDSERSVYFAGSVIVERSIKCAGRIRTGSSIEAGTSVEASSIKAGTSIKAGASIEAGLGIEAGTSIEAGGDIKAGMKIRAGANIEAGYNIEAGVDIEAGWGYGILAGLLVRTSVLGEHAKIRAKTKPANIICGVFEPWEENVEEAQS